MKKILLLLMGCMMVSSVCFGYRGIRCEPESDHVVSYIATDVMTSNSVGHAVLFVKRIDDQNNVEYWIRATVKTNEDRMLYYASFIVDGNEYKIRAMEDPRYYHIRTGVSVISSIYVTNPYEYYSVPLEIINKIRDTNNNVVIVLNRLDKQNIKVNLKSYFQSDIQRIISLNFADKDKYWKRNLIE